MPTAALADFRRGLRGAAALARLERAYTDPPAANERDAAEALRGGCAVLMVAAFEAFVRGLLPELLSAWDAKARVIHFHRLPSKMQTTSVWDGLDAALRGPRFGAPSDRVSRLPAVLTTSARVAALRINPEVFGDTQSNPSPARLKDLFSGIGVSDVFGVIKSDFDRRWGTATAETFIRDTLQDIVERRHRVAHTGSALSISRRDLMESIRFLRHLGATLDKFASGHVRHLYRVAT